MGQEYRKGVYIEADDGKGSADFLDHTVRVEHEGQVKKNNQGNSGNSGGNNNDGNVEVPTGEVGTTSTGEGYYDDHVDDLLDSSGGAEAAEDTEYEWNQKAKDQATLQYGKDREETIQEMLGDRNEIQQEGQKNQDQHAMQKYSDRQSAERAGWAGGYKLDQNRQRQYLQESIQANMYGAMELQKLGLESQLAAARLAYDINKEELALKHYETAYENAVAEAQLHGVWLSPEVRDMNQQYYAAERILEGMDDTDDAVIESSEYQRAKRVKEQIENWYSSNGVSPEGVATLAKEELDFTMDEARIQAALATIQDESAYAMTDENGDYLRTPQGGVRSINLNHDSAEEIQEFLSTAGNADQVVNSHLSNLAYTNLNQLINEYPNDSLEDIIQKFSNENDVVNFMSKVGEDIVDHLQEDKIRTDENGNRYYNIEYVHPEKGTYNIKIGLAGQGDPQAGSDQQTDPESDTIDEDTQRRLDEDPMNALTDLNDPLGFNITEQADLEKIYGDDFGNVTEMAQDYYQKMRRIDRVISGENYTAEQSDQAIEDMLWLGRQAANDADLSDYEANDWPENAYAVHKTFNAVAKQAGFDPNQFDWDWDIQTGDDAIPGIKASSLTGRQASFLEEAGFMKVERGRFLWLKDTGTDYYALESSEGRVAGLAGTDNFRKRLAEYLKKNAAVVDNSNTTEGESRW